MEKYGDIAPWSIQFGNISAKRKRPDPTTVQKCPETRLTDKSFEYGKCPETGKREKSIGHFFL